MRGRTLTIRLSSPAPDFPQRLALPYFCAVPTWAPNHQTDTLPSAGPFAIAAVPPGRSLILVRNPYYRGPRHPKVQRIIYRFGAFGSQIRLQLERGEADYGVVSPSAFAALAADDSRATAAPVRRAAADRRVSRAEHRASALQEQPVAAARSQLRARPAGARAPLRPRGRDAERRVSATGLPGLPRGTSIRSTRRTWPRRVRLQGPPARRRTRCSSPAATRTAPTARSSSRTHCGRSVCMSDRHVARPGSSRSAAVRGTEVRHRRCDHPSRLRRSVRRSSTSCSTAG